MGLFRGLRGLGAAAACALALAGAPAAAQALAPGIFPPTPRVEHTLGGDALNFDILVPAPADQAVVIGSVEVTYLDAAGQALYTRVLDFNGRAIETIPDRVLQPGQTRLLFNPYPLLPPDVRPAAVRARVGLYKSPAPLDPSQMQLAQAQDFTARIASESPPLRLILPLAGRVMVWDGHDLNAHHRRFDFVALQRVGYRSNADRYSYDLVLVDAQNRMTRGPGDANEAYIGFKAPVRAPADGVVAEARDDSPNNRQFDQRAARANLNLTFGNYLVIDHGHGRFSLLGHISQGSLKVKPGDRVKAGQTVAAVGAAGSSLFPHLHYELIDGPSTATAEGLPSYFQGLTRLRGSKGTPVRGVSIDSGDVVLAR